VPSKCAKDLRQAPKSELVHDKFGSPTAAVNKMQSSLLGAALKELMLGDLKVPVRSATNLYPDSAKPGPEFAPTFAAVPYY
jgi:hypothetical protein